MIQDNSPQLLVSRAKSGSIEALNTLLDAYKQHIYAIAFAMFNDRNDAVGAMKKSVTAVWKNIGLLEEDEDFENWLYRVTYVVCDQIRTEQRPSASANTDKLFAHAADAGLLLPARYASDAALKERLTGIIFSLPDKQREAIVLHYYHNKSVPQIADVMDCSERKAQSRLNQAIASVKASVEKEEQEHGEHYFGTENGAVPLRDFVTYYIDRNLPGQQEINEILESSRSDAYYTTNTYTAKLAKKQKKKKKRVHAAKPAQTAPRHAKKQPEPAAEKAASEPRDYSLAIKIFVIAVILALLACLGVLAYNTFLNPANRLETENVSSTAAQSTAGADIETAAPTEADADPQTEAPTDPAAEAATDAPTTASDKADHTAAYSAYRDVLEDNRDAIRSYNWQFRVDPAHPIAFADIMGDETPEMIYAYATDIGDGGDEYLTLRIMTFDSKKAVEAYSCQLTDNTRRSGGIYCVTQIDGEKNLYIFAVSSPGQLRTETAYRFVEGENNTLTQEEVVVYNPRTDLTSEERVDGKDVSADEAESAYYDLAAKSDVLLLSSSDSRGVGYPAILDIVAPNKAMTYDEAMAYLDDILD